MLSRGKGKSGVRAGRDCDGKSGQHNRAASPDSDEQQVDWRGQTREQGKHSLDSGCKGYRAVGEPSTQETIERKCTCSAHNSAPINSGRGFANTIAAIAMATRQPRSSAR